ncbi:MAG: hypothetical protein PHN63_05495, partial [Candidatus Omnitrophica bacterium]|nr:hypothetical protein [Candidatus Omnitrophota bacterium]
MDKAGRKIILVHGSFSPAKTAKAFPDLPWLYFDRDNSGLAAWEGVLGAGLKVDYKEDLTKASYGLRDEFVEWSARLGKPHWDKWYWWVTGLATRSNVTSNFYLYVCYIEVLKEVLAKNGGDIIIVSNSRELLDIIGLNWKGRSVIVKPCYLEDLLKRILRYLKVRARPVYYWSRFFKRSFSEWAAARWTRFRFGRKAEHVYDKDHVVINTYVNDECMGGEFRDKYFPGLSQHLAGKGMKVSTLIQIFYLKDRTFSQALKWFRKSKESFLIPQDYYNLWDCFGSFLTVIKSSRFTFPRESCYFRGIYIRPLIDMEQREQSQDTWLADFINQMKMFGNWKKLRYGLKIYIDTWELKKGEVPALVAIQKYFPSCRTIAYQHAALIPKLLFFNFKTTPEEFDASPHADIGIANSRVTKEFLLKEGFPGSFVRLGRALRYKWWEKYA